MNFAASRQSIAISSGLRSMKCCTAMTYRQSFRSTKQLNWRKPTAVQSRAVS
jgi:hypothetical protein